MPISQLSTYQSEVLNLMSFVKSEETFLMMKQALSDFFAKEADKELTRLWNCGVLNDQKIEEFRSLHERT